MPDIIHKPIASHASSFLEALKTGSTTAILGMVIVFAVLAVIFAALVIMRKALNRKPKASAAETIAPVVVSAPTPEEQPAEESTDDCAIVAAIVAAISAHTGKAPTSFRVVSFKRRH